MNYDSRIHELKIFPTTFTVYQATKSIVLFSLPLHLSRNLDFGVGVFNPYVSKTRNVIGYLFLSDTFEGSHTRVVLLPQQ